MTAWTTWKANSLGSGSRGFLLARVGMTTLCRVARSEASQKVRCKVADDQVKALNEIRDVLREGLEQSKRASSESLASQKKVIEQYEKMSRNYRLMTKIGGLFIVILLALIGFLLWWTYGRAG